MAARFDLHAFHYAHRGLWQSDGPPENSLSAFRAAAAAGLGIEFDVRPARDGETMIFHDALLERMTAGEGLFEAQTSAALRKMRLKDSEDGVPDFDALLSLWPQELPLLTEMKIDGSTDAAAFARRVGARLLQRDGRAAAMSFSEEAVRALPEDLMRGQLIYPSARSEAGTFEGVLERAISDRIDYLAVHHSDLDRVVGAPLPVVTWTVRTAEELAHARGCGAALIFEHLPLALITETGA